MRFLDKLFGKSEAEEKKPFSVDEAVSLSRQKLSALDFSGLKAALKAALDAVPDAEHRVSSLKAAKLPEKIDPRLASAATESKDQLCLVIGKSLDAFKQAAGRSSDSLEWYRGVSRVASEEMRRIAAGNPKHSYYAGMVFKNEMNALGKALAALTDRAGALSAEVARTDSENATYRRIAELDDRRQALARDVGESEKKTAETRAKKAAAEQKAAELTERVEKAVNELETETYKASPEKLEAELREAEAAIFAAVSSISRPLKRYEKVCNADKATVIMLKQYIDNPIKAALSDDKQLIRQIAVDTARLVASGQLDVKEGAKDKALEAARRLGEGSLEPLVKTHRELSEKVAEARKRLAPVSEAKHNAESELRNTDESARFLSEELAKTAASLDSKKKELTECGIELAKAAAGLAR